MSITRDYSLDGANLNPIEARIALYAMAKNSDGEVELVLGFTTRDGENPESLRFPLKDMANLRAFIEVVCAKDPEVAMQLDEYE